MPETNLQHSHQLFYETRQAVLNGELSASAAVTRLTQAGWTVRRAELVVGLWDTLGLLRPVQAGYQVSE